MKKFKLFLNEAKQFISGSYYVKKADDPDFSRYSIHHGNKEIGFLTLNKKKNNVNFVKINPEHRGKGLATALYRHIEKDIGGKMNPADEYTEAGKAFSQKYYGVDRTKGYAKKDGKYLKEIRDFTAELEAQKSRHNEEKRLRGIMESHYSDLPHHNQIANYTQVGAFLNDYHWKKHLGKLKEPPSVIENRDKQTKEMDEVVHRHSTPESMTVWSKSRHDPRDIKDENDVVHHPAYLSTSIKKHIPELEFSDRNNVYNNEGRETSNIFKIHVPKNHSGAYISHLMGNRYGEFVLPRDTKLKYHGTDTVESGGILHHTHHMEVLPHDEV